MKNYIPTINISSLLKGNFNSISSKNTIKKIETACLDIGFFQITKHGISKKSIHYISKVGSDFFNSSISNKMKLASKKWNKLNKNLKNVIRATIDFYCEIICHRLTYDVDLRLLWCYDR